MHCTRLFTSLNKLFSNKKLLSIWKVLKESIKSPFGLLVNVKHLKHFRNSDNFLPNSSQRMDAVLRIWDHSVPLEECSLSASWAAQSPITDLIRNVGQVFSGHILAFIISVIGSRSAFKSRQNSLICKTRLSGNNLWMKVSDCPGFRLGCFVNCPFVSGSFPVVDAAQFCYVPPVR